MFDPIKFNYTNIVQGDMLPVSMFNLFTCIYGKKIAIVSNNIIEYIFS